MVKVAVLGATGYTALELLKILLRHPEVEIVAVTSRQDGSPPISSVHPSLVGRLDLALEDCLVVAGHSMQQPILAAVLLHDLSVHLAEVLLGLLHEPVDLSLQVVAGALRFQLRDPLLQLRVLVLQLLFSAHAHQLYSNAFK